MFLSPDTFRTPKQDVAHSQHQKSIKKNELRTRGRNKERKIHSDGERPGVSVLLEQTQSQISQEPAGFQEGTSTDLEVARDTWPFGITFSNHGLRK